MSLESNKPVDLIWMRPEPGQRTVGLSRDAIAAAALRIADTEGIEKVSMRRVAAELDAGTMSLYHYILSKDELLSLMGDAVMGEVLIPDGEMSDDWREAISEIARRTREMFMRHPWIVMARGGSEGSPNGMRHFEQSLAAVAGTGLSDADRMDLITLVDDYVFGVAVRDIRIREWTGAKSTPSGEDWPDQVAEYFGLMLETGDFPNLKEFAGPGDLRAKMERMSEISFDPSRFERGLEKLLDGIEAGIMTKSG